MKTMRGPAIFLAQFKAPFDSLEHIPRFVKDHIIRVTERTFDDFVASGANGTFNRRVLGLA